MNKKRYAIPLMAAAALVPLITFVTARKADFSAFPWFPNQNYWVDIFLYGKSRLLMGLGVIMGGILAYEGVRSRLRKP